MFILYFAVLGRSTRVINVSQIYHIESTADGLLVVHLFHSLIHILLICRHFILLSMLLVQDAFLHFAYHLTEFWC